MGDLWDGLITWAFLVGHVNYKKNPTQLVPRRVRLSTRSSGCFNSGLPSFSVTSILDSASFQNRICIRVYPQYSLSIPKFKKLTATFVRLSSNPHWRFLQPPQTLFLRPKGVSHNNLTRNRKERQKQECFIICES